MHVPKTYPELDKMLRLWAANADPEAHCPVLGGNRREELIKLAENANEAQRQGVAYETYVAESLLPRLGLPSIMMDMLMSHESMNAPGFNPLLDMLMFSDEDDTPPLGMPPMLMMAVVAEFRIRMRGDIDEATDARLRHIADLKQSMPETAHMSLIADIQDVPLEEDDETIRAWLRANVTAPQAQPIGVAIEISLPMLPQSLFGGVERPTTSMRYERLIRFIQNALRRTPPENRDLDFYDHLGVSQYNLGDDAFDLGDKDDTEE